MIATVRSRPSRTTVTRAGAAARQPLVCAPAQRWVEICRLSASVPPRTPSTATTGSPGCRTFAAPRVGSSVSTRLVTPSATPQPEQQHHQEQEGQHDVDRRAGGDDDDPLPDRLAEVGAVGDLRRDLLRRVHARDPHVAAERDRADRVLRLAAAHAAEQRREEEREALHAHPDGLGGREVAELVQDDQRGEAQEGEQPAQAATPIASSATRRAVGVGGIQRVEGVHARGRELLERPSRSPRGCPRSRAGRPGRRAPRPRWRR